MATVIDSLIVKLKLDSKDFDKGRDKGKQAIKGLSKDTKEASANIGNMNNAFLRLFAIVGGAVAIKSFASDVISSNAALYRFAENTGLAIEKISQLSGASRIAGAHAGDLENAIAKISMAQTELKLTGQSSLVNFMSYLGVAMTDQYGNAIPATKMLKDLNTQMSKMDKQTAFNLGQMMGLTPDFMNFIMKSPREFDRIVKSQEQLARVSKETAKQSEYLREKWMQSQLQLEALGASIVNSLLPYMIKAVDAFESMSNWVKNNGRLVDEFLIATATALTLYYTPAIVRATAATAAMLAPFLLIGGAIAALTLAIDDMIASFNGLDSAIDWRGLNDQYSGNRDAMLNGARDYLSNMYNNTSNNIHNAYEAARTEIQTNIGEVKIFTQATDANGIANALPNALTNAFNYDSGVK